MVHGPKERRERQLGEHLHLKGFRCDSPKCAIVRRPYKPGQHGANMRRKAPSDFARQLAEKQKFKLSYGIHERTLRRLFEMAALSPAGTDRKLLELLERRLDNVVFRLGFAPSRAAARQLVGQGHVLVGGRKVRSPGYQVKEGDIIAIREESRGNSLFKEMVKELEKTEPPLWLSRTPNALEGTVVKLPEHEEAPFEINLLVESFSK